MLIANPTRHRAELDAATLARAQAGDATAWRALIEHDQGPVFGLLGRARPGGPARARAAVDPRELPPVEIEQGRAAAARELEEQIRERPWPL